MKARGPSWAILGLASAAAFAAAFAHADPAPRAEPRPPARVELLGHSARGRPVRAVHLGEEGAPRKVLVVGSIHGDEPAGIAVVRALRRSRPPEGTELVLVKTVNPDGLAAHTRQNARGVDLNRNFPRKWRRLGRRGFRYWSGRRPLSEPESRLVARLVQRLRPAVSIWFHQPYGIVDLAGGPDPAVVRRYARLTGLPTRPLPNYPGSATRWQNHLLPGASAFVVEFPRGRVSAATARRHARAVLALAAPPLPPLAPNTGP